MYIDTIAYANEEISIIDVMKPDYKDIQACVKDDIKNLAAAGRNSRRRTLTFEDALPSLTHCLTELERILRSLPQANNTLHMGKRGCI
jgi:hypothetical protein